MATKPKYQFWCCGVVGARIGVSLTANNSTEAYLGYEIERKIHMCPHDRMEIKRTSSLGN